MKDYIVIHECTIPYEERTEWKIVSKCIGPVDAIEKAKFRVPTSQFADHMLYVFELGESLEGVKFIPREGPVVWRKA